MNNHPSPVSIGRLAMTALFVASVVAGCAAEPDEPLFNSEAALVSDIVSLSRRADGRFDVVCRGASGGSNYAEISDEAAVLGNRVCASRPPQDCTTPTGRSRWYCDNQSSPFEYAYKPIVVDVASGKQGWHLGAYPTLERCQLQIRFWCSNGVGYNE